MIDELKTLYDYQWELTLTGARLDERILRCSCSCEVEAEVRGLCRKLIITAADIKYRLISLEQVLPDEAAGLFSDPESNALVADAFQQIERILYLVIKDYVNLMASLEGLKKTEDAFIIVKKFWPKIAETYQYFKAMLIRAEKEIL